MENVKIKKCPNCGAVIEHNYNYKCPYCRTYLHITDEEIKKINNIDLVFEDIEFERSSIRNSILITIEAKTYPRANWYEEGNINIGEIYISGTNTINKVFYRIEIPTNTFYDSYYSGNFEKILEIVKSSLPPQYRKYEYEIYRKIVEKLYEREVKLNI